MKSITDIITEELSKPEIESLVSSKISSSMKSNDFKKAVKELAADVVSELFKTLWQRNNVWKNSVV